MTNIIVVGYHLSEHNVVVTAVSFISSCSLSFLCSQEVLTQIEEVMLGILTSLSKDQAPVLVFPNRSSWANVR